MLNPDENFLENFFTEWRAVSNACIEMAQEDVTTVQQVHSCHGHAKVKGVFDVKTIYSYVQRGLIPYADSVECVVCERTNASVGGSAEVLPLIAEIRKARQTLDVKLAAGGRVTTRQDVMVSIR